MKRFLLFFTGFLAIFSLFFCGDPIAGSHCDDYGEVACGTACGEMVGNTCAIVSAVLWCDGYEWVVSQKCYDCMCREKGSGAYCDCY